MAEEDKTNDVMTAWLSGKGGKGGEKAGRRARMQRARSSQGAPHREGRGRG